MEARADVGIIGGSGLYDLESLGEPEEVLLETPFGRPSDAYLVSEIDGVRIAFLPRHARGHRIMPTELNYRANVFGFKMLGVERILSASAVGSMKEQYRPTDVLLPDQFIDRTRHRPETFFGDGLVAHVSLADPFCAELGDVLEEAGREAGARMHRGGTYLSIEGPQFSTRAESFLYRSWGVDVIGMTNVQEARLAREAEICYATAALVTDYDCWHASEEEVTVDQVLAVLKQNSKMAARMLALAAARIPRERECGCGSALAPAVITAREAIPAETRARLAPIVGKYLPEG